MATLQAFILEHVGYKLFQPFPTGHVTHCRPSCGADRLAAMLSTKAARSLARSLRGQGRFYSTQTSTDTWVPQFDSTPINKEPIKVTKLGNGLTVASCENASLLSRVGIAVKAGARNESADYLGVTHFLRNALSVTTSTTHCASIVRGLAKQGCYLSCTSNREYMFYQVEGSRENIDKAIDMMFGIVCEPIFYQHEITDVVGLVKFDIQRLQTSAMLMEDLHKVAFSGGLGNSIYCRPYQINNLTSDMMHAYRLSLYKEPKMAFVGVGVDSDFMESKAAELPASLSLLGTVVEKETKYIGGESREQTGGGLGYVAMVTEGPSMTNKDAMAAGVLQQLMGVGCHIKFSPGVVSRLGKAVHTAIGKEDYAVSAINMPYSDFGLFGFTAVGNAADMEAIVRAASAEFASISKGGAFSDKDVEAAKNRLKATISMELDQSGNLLNYIGESVLMSGSAAELSSIMQSVDNVTSADVAKVAKKIVNGKPTMVGRGDLNWTPRLAELV